MALGCPMSQSEGEVQNRLRCKAYYQIKVEIPSCSGNENALCIITVGKN